MIDIKNKDLPVTPIKLKLGESTLETFGLTKREYFAAMAMQGLLSRNKEDALPSHEKVKHYASLSLKSADALLAELDKDCVKEVMK